jgi:beta-glucosidase/6-phospho-beta-glucosidase/beta-galactosidase
MPQGDFLSIIRNTYGGDEYAGDEHGGARGESGNGLPDGSPGSFMFATGIECSNPTIDNGRIRRDLLEETGHYDHWREDLNLVRDLGLKVLRYHLPYHKTHLGPGKYDWSFADEVMPEMQRLGITPIMDLLHFGVPDWLGNFQNPELPTLFCQYADAFAERFPWVRFYTPVNEIYVAAKFSGRDGIWNEQLKSDKGFVTAIKHLVAASILANHRIALRRPNCVIVQSESAELVHEARAERTPEVQLANRQRFLSLDLLYANAPDADTMFYLLDNGLTRDEYAWFMKGEPPGYQIMGTDYYASNERVMTPDGSMLPAQDVAGWYQITRDYYDRYRKPVMHTETNVSDRDEAPNWLWKQWLNIIRMRESGVPVLGFTWYSLVDQVDWDIGLAEKNGRVNPNGLYDLNRQPNPVAGAFRQLLEEFGRITVVPHGEFLDITDRPARLKFSI